MSSITLNTSIGELLKTHPESRSFFIQNNINIVKDEKMLDTMGNFIKLDTILTASNIDKTQFMELFEKWRAKPHIEKTFDDAKKEFGKLNLLMVLPCGVKGKITDAIEEFTSNNKEYNYTFLSEGNVNYETFFDKEASTGATIDRLPDCLITSDINSFYHKEFIDRYIKPKYFERVGQLNDANFGGIEFQDPQNNYTMLAMNIIVFVIDKTKVGNRKRPATWQDLLSDEFEDSIAIRGDGNFFCNAVLLPYYKDGGIEYIKRLAKNVRYGMHPAEMAKQAGSPTSTGACIYAMPYFFAETIKHKENVEIVFPDDGAIVSPVAMLVKKEKMGSIKPLIDFLTGEKIAKIFTESFHPAAINGITSPVTKDKTYKWIGWDFIYGNDIHYIKEEIGKTFMSIYREKQRTGV